jgi:hypothetical protein
MTSSVPPPPGQDPETLRAYWLNHRQRSTELEQQRLQVSNFVVASSVVALGIVAATNAPNTAVVVVVGLAVALFNLMAWAYSWQSDRWSHYYSARAQHLLEGNWLYLKNLEAEVRESVKRPHDSHNWFRREQLQIYLHVILAIASIVLAIVVPITSSRPAA